MNRQAFVQVFEEIRQVGWPPDELAKVALFQDGWNSLRIEVSAAAGEAPQLFVRVLEKPEWDALRARGGMQQEGLAKCHAWIVGLVQAGAPDGEGERQLFFENYEPDPGLLETKAGGLKSDLQSLFAGKKMRSCGNLVPVIEGPAKDVDMIRAASKRLQMDEQTMEAFHDWYKRVDTSGDGRLDEAEFGKFLQHVMQVANRAQEDSKKVWRELTQNDNEANCVSFPQWVDWLMEKLPYVAHMQPWRIRQIADGTPRGHADSRADLFGAAP